MLVPCLRLRQSLNESQRYRIQPLEVKCLRGAWGVDKMDSENKSTVWEALPCIVRERG